MDTSGITQHYPVLIRVLEQVKNILSARCIAMHYTMIDIRAYLGVAKDFANTFQHVPIWHKHQHFMLGTLDQVEQRGHARRGVQANKLWVLRIHPTTGDL